MGSLDSDRIVNASAWLCLGIASLVFWLPIGNPDLWWHLSAARFIVENGAFPREEWLSHTMAGMSWADFEWGVQLIWYGLYQVGGVKALLVFKAGFFFAIAAVLWRTLGLYSVGFAARAFGVFGWALATTIGNDVRPENFSLLFFAILWFLLEQRRLDPTSDRKWILGSLGAFVLWANLHAGFAYGLILLGIYAVADFSRRGDKTLIAACIAGAAGALVNPYGANVYLVMLQHAAEGETLQLFIREWGEASLLAPSLIPFWIILLASFAVLLRGQLKKKNAPIEHIAALLLFSLSAVTHIRTAVYFLTIAIAVLGAGLVRIPASRSLIVLGTVVGTLFSFVIPFPAFKGMHVLRSHYIPIRATAFLLREKAVLAGKPLFNPWHWGGYLGYQLYPDYRIFMDGRYLFHWLLPGVNEARQSPQRYQSYMAAHGVEIALVQRLAQYVSTPVTRKDGSQEKLLRPFYLHFLPRKEWGLVHWDPQALVFVRRDVVAADWMRKHEYRYFRPDDLSAAMLMLREGVIPLSKIEAEVERYRSGPIPDDEREQTEAWLKILREERL